MWKEEEMAECFFHLYSEMHILAGRREYIYFAPFPPGFYGAQLYRGHSARRAVNIVLTEE